MGKSILNQQQTQTHAGIFDPRTAHLLIAFIIANSSKQINNALLRINLIPSTLWKQEALVDSVVK